MQQSCYIVRFVKFIVNLNELFFTINLSESIGIIITQVGVINLNVALNLIMRGEELVHTMSEVVVSERPDVKSMVNQMKKDSDPCS